jgi:hypothetical protein
LLVIARVVSLLNDVSAPDASWKLTRIVKGSPGLTSTCCEPFGDWSAELTLSMLMYAGPVGVATAELITNPPNAVARQAASRMARRRRGAVMTGMSSVSLPGTENVFYRLSPVCRAGQPACAL